MKKERFLDKQKHLNYGLTLRAPRRGTGLAESHMSTTRFRSRPLRASQFGRGAHVEKWGFFDNLTPPPPELPERIFWKTGTSGQ